MRVIKNPDVATVYERLSACKVGDTVHYSNISAALGYDIRERSYILMSARKRVQNELRYVFSTIIGVGVQRMSDAEIVNTGAHSIGQIRERSERAAKTLACVQDFNSMSNDQKLAHNASLSILGALSIMLEPERVKRVGEATGAKMQVLAIQETLAALR